MIVCLGMVFDHDWFAVPFVMMTCQVQNIKNSLWFGLVWFSFRIMCQVKICIKNPLSLHL